MHLAINFLNFLNILSKDIYNLFERKDIECRSKDGQWMWNGDRDYDGGGGDNNIEKYPHIH